MRQNIQFIILVINLLCWIQTHGQQQICLDVKAHLGTAGFNSDGTLAHIENKGPFFNQYSFLAGIKYKVGKHIGIGFHIFNQKSKWNFADNQSISLNNGDYIKIKTQSVIQVQGFSGNMELRFPVKSSNRIEWIFSPGYCFGDVKPVNSLTEYIYHAPEISIIQNITNKKFSSAFFETGFCFNSNKRIGINTFLGYNYSFKPVYECDFKLQTNDIAGNTKITSKSSGLYFGASLSVALIHIKKKEKKKHFVPEFNDKQEITAINGRKVNSDHQLAAKSGNLEIQVWDYGKEDGDKISLFINDQQLLKKYTLTRKKKQLQIKLKPGMNKLIVYAHNLGKDPPNTASVVIFDGNEKHVISLESTLGECGAVEIYWQP
jgi:hypothetical protein